MWPLGLLLFACLLSVKLYWYMKPYRISLAFWEWRFPSIQGPLLCLGVSQHMWGRGLTPSCPQTRPTCLCCSASWSSPCLTLSPMLCFPVMIEAWSRVKKFGYNEAYIYILYILFISDFTLSNPHFDIQLTESRIYLLITMYMYLQNINRLSLANNRFSPKVKLIFDITDYLMLEKKFFNPWPHPILIIF